MPSYLKSITVAICLMCFCIIPQSLKGQHLYVSAVLDGEHVVLSNGERVELIGVDAVEKFSGTEQWQDVMRLGADRESIETKGGIAAAYLSVLVKSRKILVSYQEGSDSELSYKYVNFRPAFVFVLDSEGRLDFLLNKKLIEEGYAFADAQTPDAYKEQFIALQNQAMVNGKGLWGRGDAVNQQVSSPIVNPSGNADLNSYCRSVKGCVWISGENQAVGSWATMQGQSCPCAK